MKQEQVPLKKRIADLEIKVDNSEQQRLRDDLVITGDFQIEPLSPANISSFDKKSCGTELPSSSITNCYATKSKQGKTVLNVTISN